MYSGKIAQISAGVAHASAVTPEGRLLVWGSNRQCQLGYPQKLREAHRPIMFGGQIEGTCILKEDGQDGSNAQPRVYFDAQLQFIY